MVVLVYDNFISTVITEIIRTGFSFFIIVCLLVRWVAPQMVSREAVNIQSAISLTLAIGILIEFLLFKSLTYDLAYTVPANDRLEFDTPDFIIQRALFYLVIYFFAGLIFFIRKARTNWVLGLLALVVANWGIILQWYMSLSGDYQPSAWAIYNQFIPVWVRIILFVPIVFLFYVYLAKRKKLPYHSAWKR